MNRKAFVLLPVVLLLVVSVSGCTGIPGLESFCIPGFGTCGQTVEYANDVLVISTLSAIPQTISTNQQIRLSAWILNNGGETVPQKTFSEMGDSESNLVRVQLYDTCEGLFDNIVVSCPGERPTQDNRGCWIGSILPKQTIPISWTLTAKGKDNIPLETSCNLKVYVQYPYETKSITSVTFVDYTEYQRMLDENKLTTITSYITEGYGPVKPYLTVETQQPYPVTNGQRSEIQMAFQVINKGSGFLAPLYKSVEGIDNFIGIANSDIEIASSTNTGGSATYDISSKIAPKIEAMGNIILIGGKDSPKQTFSIETPYNNKIEKIATYYVTGGIKYMYEFRKEIKVTIKPPAISG